MTELHADRDAVRRYQCTEAKDARIITVHLDQAVADMLDHQAMPEPVKMLCQELTAAACILSNMLKFEGDMILQTKSDGPVRLLMAECSSDGRIRATAQWDDAVSATGFQELMGTGYLAVTVEPSQGERYQGIVPLEADSLAGCLNQYFENSEQLDTRVWLASDGVQCGGLLLQRLPSEGGYDSEAQDTWSTLEVLAQTVTSNELVESAGPLLAYRLFSEFEPRGLEAWPLHFGCSCSRERSARAIRALGESEVVALFTEQTQVQLDCHFCGQVYLYDQADLEWLLSDQPPGSDTLQ